jgi:hypothetical protein
MPRNIAAPHWRNTLPDIDSNGRESLFQAGRPFVIGRSDRPELSLMAIIYPCVEREVSDRLAFFGSVEWRRISASDRAAKAPSDDFLRLSDSEIFSACTPPALEKKQENLGLVLSRRTEA